MEPNIFISTSMYQVKSMRIEGEIVSIKSYYVKGQDEHPSVILKIKDRNTGIYYDVQDRPYSFHNQFGRYEKELTEKLLPMIKEFTDKKLLYYLQDCIYFPYRVYTASILEYDDGEIIRYYCMDIKEVKPPKEKKENDLGQTNFLRNPYRNSEGME